MRTTDSVSDFQIKQLLTSAIVVNSPFIHRAAEPSPLHLDALHAISKALNISCDDAAHPIDPTLKVVNVYSDYCMVEVSRDRHLGSPFAGDLLVGHGEACQPRDHQLLNHPWRHG